jgi:hypothetical protein
MPHVGIERLPPWYHQKHRTEYEKARKPIPQKKPYRIQGVNGGEDLGNGNDPPYSENRKGTEPEKHEGPEYCPHGPGTPLLKEEQGTEDCDS